MKCKNLLGMLTIALSIGVVADASAFGLPKIGGSNDSANTNNTESLDSVIVQQDSLVKTYQSSLGDILSAQALFLEAYGKKEDAAKLVSAAEAIGKGSVDKDEFAKSTTLSKDANETIRKDIAEGEELSSEGRAKYQEGLLPYASGVGKIAKLRPEFEKFTQSAKAQLDSASMMEKLKVKKQLDVGIYLATKAPGYVADLASTTKEILTFAKKQGVSEQTTDKLTAAVSLNL
jgi:hypothetical protein